MPQDNVADLQIGQAGNILSGELFVDYTNNTISGPGLNVEVLGQSVPLDATTLTLTPNADGSYSIAGATVAAAGIPAANVQLTLASQTPLSTNASVTVLGTTTTATEVVAQVTCFATGTHIRTTRGDCAVEELVVGDVAVTASGDTRSIVWIGHRDIDCRDQHELHPVRVAASAFGADLPTRDLWLSPGHPVLIGADADNEGGHLVPIMCLVNGTTIARMPVDTVTYWHVELDAHDILLAEGLPAESYLDWGDRGFFQEGSDHRIENPDFVVPGLAGRCRPVALDGPIVEAARRKLDTAFAMRLASAAAWPDAEDALAV